MAYIDVISLATAKEHLRVDTGYTDDDAHITRIISSALSYIERYTNIYVYARDIVFDTVGGCVRVYHFPINDVVDPSDDSETVVKRQLHSTYTHGVEDASITLNVGHALPVNVPTELIEVALEYIELAYLGNDAKRQLSHLSKDTLNSFKRFII